MEKYLKEFTIYYTLESKVTGNRYLNLHLKFNAYTKLHAINQLIELVRGSEMELIKINSIGYKVK